LPQLRDGDASVKVEIWEKNIIFKDKLLDSAVVDLGAIPSGVRFLLYPLRLLARCASTFLDR
jgi:hypothetical protein